MSEKYAKHNVMITFYVSEETANRLKELAKNRGVKLSQLLREIINEYLSKADK